MARSALVATFLLSTTAPTVWGEVTGCLVRKYEHVTDPTSTHILSFVKPFSHLDIIVQFQDRDLTFYRDWVKLTNSRVTHCKVRGGTSNQTDSEMLMLIPQGWNRLHLEAVGARLELTLLSGDGEEATLLELGLDFPVASVHVEGTFALCSGDSPEWEVNETEKVSVLLQPEHTQQLQVTGRGDAKPYLVVPSADLHPVQNISANTILSIETRRRRSVVYVEIFRKGAEDNKESLTGMEQPVDSPTVLIGCHAGTLHLRLDLSPETAKCNSHSVDHSGGDFVLLWPMGYVLLFGGVAIGCLCGVLAALLFTKKTTRKDTAAGACKKKFLPAQHQTATEKLVRTVEEGRDEE